ncbi:MAG: hypothetical protein LIO95_07340 [Clostridiales bacterium]|nr:hypothetical protein [Clostridiales bacterium]
MTGTITHHLSLDLETYSSEDIGKSGLYRYAQSPDFAILLLAWSLDDRPVEVIDLTTTPRLPTYLTALLQDPCTLKHAYNAAFEWYCLGRYFGLDEMQLAAWLPQWRCTMLHGMYCGYPAGLAATGRALGLPEDKQKLATGKALIKYFCRPCPPTKTNGGRTRNLPQHAPEKWELFVEYNRQDVVTEMEIERRLRHYPVPEAVQAQWETDQKINLRGVGVDRALVDGARVLDAAQKERYREEARTLTGLDNPNSRAQLLAWVQGRGVDTDNIRANTVKDLLAEPSKLPGDTARVLELRQELSKTSTAKYETLDNVVCGDGRVRGLLQFYGAGRTGRWAGRLVQPQNLPRTYIKPELLPLARTLVQTQNEAALEAVFGSTADTLSQLIRTAFVPRAGNVFVDADFSAVEARVIAWLAGEEWVLEVFRTHGKIYEATASQMFGIPLEKIKKGNPEYSYRQRGKVATLALGYGGSVGAMRQMDTGKALIDLPDEDIMDMVDRWRKANPAIVQFWYSVSAAAFEALDTGRTIPLRGGSLAFARECDPANDLDFLTIRLPSGRKLYYVKPHRTKDRWGRPAVGYWGMNQTTRKWTEMETYGGRLAENITQAVARDLLAEGIEQLEAAGYPVVFHIHDEVVVDTPDRDALPEVAHILAQTPEWAAGLPLNAEGWTGDYFRKD